MFLLAIALYFALACLLGSLAVFPSVRGIFAQPKQDARRQFKQAISMKWITRLLERPRSPGLKRHWLALSGLSILCVPSIWVLCASKQIRLDEPEDFGVQTRDINLQVTELFNGEHLAPPVAPPPLLFATREIEALRPLLGSASRNWSMLNADYAQRLLMSFRIMKERHGYVMAILEGYRSPERQTMLAKMGSNVTNAAAFQSWHQYGLAADCAFLRDGALHISEKDPWTMRGYRLYGEVAESLGLRWGGRWKSMDFGHTELRLPGVMHGPH